MLWQGSKVTGQTQRYKLREINETRETPYRDKKTTLVGASGGRTTRTMAGESGVDLNFDFIDFDSNVFDDDSTFSLLDKATNDVMFYELKSKTVPEETET